MKDVAYGRQIYRCCHAQLNTAPQISGVKTRTTVERFESELVELHCIATMLTCDKIR